MFFILDEESDPQRVDRSTWAKWHVVPANYERCVLAWTELDAAPPIYVCTLFRGDAVDASGAAQGMWETKLYGQAVSEVARLRWPGPEAAAQGHETTVERLRALVAAGSYSEDRVPLGHEVNGTLDGMTETFGLGELQPARTEHELWGGWLLVGSEGYLLTRDESLAVVLRGGTWITDCEGNGNWDESTMPAIKALVPDVEPVQSDLSPDRRPPSPRWKPGMPSHLMDEIDRACSHYWMRAGLIGGLVAGLLLALLMAGALAGCPSSPYFDQAPQ